MKAKLFITFFLECKFTIFRILYIEFRAFSSYLISILGKDYPESNYPLKIFVKRRWRCQAQADTAPSPCIRPVFLC